MKLRFWFGLFLIFLGGLIMGISLALMTVKPAHAYEFAENWTWTDTAYETVFIGLNVADWGYTRNIAKHPENCSENNPLLGRHPSLEKVDVLIPAGMVVHAAVSMALKPVYHVEIFSYEMDIPARRLWQVVFIAIEGWFDISNASVGLKIDF